MAETPFSPESSPEGNPAGDFAENAAGDQAGSPFPPAMQVGVEAPAGEAALHGGDSPAAGPDDSGDHGIHPDSQGGSGGEGASTDLTGPVTEAGGATPEGTSTPAWDQASRADAPSLNTPEAAAPAEAVQAEALKAPEAPAENAPWSAAAPSPVAEAEPASPEPALEGVATTMAVPPLETAAGSTAEGGEWELLVGKLNAWFGSGELERQWQKLRGPLQGVAILIGVILALRLYGTVVGTIDSIPLVSGLLELTGLIALGHFGLTKMIKTSEREQVLARWKQRWQSFRGES